MKTMTEIEIEIEEIEKMDNEIEKTQAIFELRNTMRDRGWRVPETPELPITGNLDTAAKELLDSIKKAIKEQKNKDEIYTKDQI
jgi:division protein CdvB (Snf7/Vps24/ESCRT-III family)